MEPVVHERPYTPLDFVTARALRYALRADNASAQRNRRVIATGLIMGVISGAIAGHHFSRRKSIVAYVAGYTLVGLCILEGMLAAKGNYS